ncbi:hypothetical protein BD410DRAFT_792080 [Rickenella mellea]|uniref:Uncharacterized protein n=1 Tax=Rickenella mellea TaxID=50990 RepID=A0A4Y7PVQ5_9AGAM|nr:hypothetical protein BD410DRAFT_792080 [Rickenella mellea]
MRIASLVYLLSFVAVLANASPLPSDVRFFRILSGHITHHDTQYKLLRRKMTWLGPSPDKRGFQTFQARATAAGGGVGVTQGATPTSVAVVFCQISCYKVLTNKPKHCPS